MADDPKVVDGAAPATQEPVSKTIDDPITKLLSDFGGKIELIQKELRGLQGRQDKQDSAFKTQMAEYDKLIKRGMSHDEAVDALENKQRESSTLADLQKKYDDLAKRLEGGQPKSATQEVVTAFEQFGLDLKDPRVIIEMQKPYANMADALLAAFTLKQSMSSTPNPNPAQAPAPAGGDAARVDAQALIAESEALMSNPSKNYERIMKIQEELQRAGIR